MNVAITGATGMIGPALVALLQARGHHCTVLSRDQRRAASCGFGPGVTVMKTEAALAEFPNVDAVIHLAGENIAALWTPRKRRRILESRVEGTRLLIEAMRRAASPPKVLLCASAIGIYGHRPGETLDEQSAPDPAGSFRARVCAEWERTAQLATAHGIRVVHLRIGNVMDTSGGYFAALSRLSWAGLGFIHGEPEARISWIALEDCVRLIGFAMEDNELSGPVNIVAPHPITQRTMASTLADYHRRPVRGRLPRRLLQSVLGELSGTIIDDQNILPRRMLQTGFVFQYPAWRPWVAALNGDEDPG